MGNQSKKIGGAPVHIQDCYLWAEIYYLDSPTDYCESISKEPDYPVSVVASDLVMLHSSRNRSNSNRQAVWKISLLLLVISGLLLYFLIYFLM
jgi:hypothetical protein